MTDTANLAAALAKVQAELPKLERDRTVTVVPKDKDKPPYSYSYVTLANLSEAVLPLLARHGLSFAALPGTGPDGRMCLRYQLMHESGDTLTGEFPLSGEGGIQALGGRITYARRYCLAAIVGVSADEDDETRLTDDGAPRATQQAAPRAARRPRSTPGKPAPQDVPKDEPFTAPQRAKMMALFGQLGLGKDRDGRLALSSALVGRTLTSANDLTKDEAGGLIDALEQAAQQADPIAWLGTVVLAPDDQATA